MRVAIWLSLCVAAACSTAYSGEDAVPAPGGSDAGDAQSDTNAPADDDGGRGDASAPRCADDTPFDAPRAIAELNADDVTSASPHLLPDEKTIIFSRQAGSELPAIVIASRNALTDPFGAPSVVAALLWDGGNHNPSLSTDGMILFYDTARASTFGDLWSATRTTPDGPFAAPSKIGDPGIADNAFDGDPFLTASGDELFFVSSRAWGGNPAGSTSVDIYHAARSQNGGWSTPLRIDELSSVSFERHPTLSEDGLTIYFASDRDGRPSGDIYRARRATRTAPFGPPVAVPELNSPSEDSPGWLSPDGCRLYLASKRDAALARLYVAIRRP